MKRYLIAIAALMLVASMAVAQGGGQGRGAGGQRGFGGGGGQILNNERVQTELKLTVQQKTQIADLLEEMRGQRGGRGQGGGGAAGGGRGQGQQGENPLDAGLKKILNETQFKRYTELSLQQQGPSALARPDYAGQVGLSEQQVQQIREIQQEMREEQRGMFQGGGGGGNRDAMMEQMNQLRAKYDKEILGLLNAQQKQKWTSMLGAKFDFGPIN